MIDFRQKELQLFGTGSALFRGGSRKLRTAEAEENSCASPEAIADSIGPADGRLCAGTHKSGVPLAGR